MYESQTKGNLIFYATLIGNHFQLTRTEDVALRKLHCTRLVKGAHSCVFWPPGSTWNWISATFNNNTSITHYIFNMNCYSTIYIKKAKSKDNVLDFCINLCNLLDSLHKKKKFLLLYSFAMSIHEKYTVHNTRYNQWNTEITTFTFLHFFCRNKYKYEIY